VEEVNRFALKANLGVVQHIQIQLMHLVCEQAFDTVTTSKMFTSQSGIVESAQGSANSPATIAFQAEDERVERAEFSMKLVVVDASRFTVAKPCQPIQASCEVWRELLERNETAADLPGNLQSGIVQADEDAVDVRSIIDGQIARGGTER